MTYLLNPLSRITRCPYQGHWLHVRAWFDGASQRRQPDKMITVPTHPEGWRATSWTFIPLYLVTCTPSCDKYKSYDLFSCFTGIDWHFYFQGNTSQHCNPNTESKRPSKPVNITPLCRLSPTVANHIHITWTPKYGQVRVFKFKTIGFWITQSIICLFYSCVLFYSNCFV